MAKAKKIYNQRKVKITYERPKGKTHEPFFAAYNAVVLEASRELKGNAFKAYIFLLTQCGRNEIGFSPQALVNQCGLSIDGAKMVFNELYETGYIYKNADDEYEFDGTKHFVIKEDSNNSSRIFTPRLAPERKRFWTLDGKSKDYTYEEYYEENKGCFSKELIDKFWNQREAIN